MTEEYCCEKLEKLCNISEDYDMIGIENHGCVAGYILKKWYEIDYANWVDDLQFEYCPYCGKHLRI